LCCNPAYCCTQCCKCPVYAAEFDYSRLSGPHKGTTSKKEREGLTKKLKEEIDAAAAELAASAPNMKALEQYEAIRDKERQQVGRHAEHMWALVLVESLDSLDSSCMCMPGIHPSPHATAYAVPSAC
jgi:hypothetical protein